jgi:hypothetical protein
MKTYYGPMRAYNFKLDIEVIYSVLILPEKYCRVVESSSQSPSYLEGFWSDRNLLVQIPMQENSKCRGEKVYSPSFSIMGVGCETKKLTPEKFTVKEMWGREKYTQDCSASKDTY